MEAELSAILDSLPMAKIVPEDDDRAVWERWQAGLTVKPTLLDELPPLRMLLVMVQPSRAARSIARTIRE